MTGSAIETSAGIGRVRHWGARLCLAECDAQARAVLSRAFLALGFESVAALRRDRAAGVDMLWRTMEGGEVPDPDPLTLANQEVLARLRPAVNQWTMRQTRIMSHDDFLALDPDTYREFMGLPGDFGHAPWRTILSVPHQVDGRCFSLGVASSERLVPGRHHDAVRYLARLYFALRTCEAEGALPRYAEADPVRALSAMQLDCLRWAAAGKGYQDIAEIVGLSPRTVRYHLDAARARYGFGTITQAIVQAAKDFDFDPLDGR